MENITIQERRQSNQSLVYYKNITKIISMNAAMLLKNNTVKYELCYIEMLASC